MRTYSVYCGKCVCGKKFEIRDPLAVCGHCNRLIEIDWPVADPAIVAENKQLILKKIKREQAQRAAEKAAEKTKREAAEAKEREERNQRVWAKLGAVK